MKLVLLGYMASGKSTIGKKLSKKMDTSFVDLDEQIVAHSGMSIPEIFKVKGEIHFRKLEAEVLQKLLNQEKELIIALGGGTPCYGTNMELIHNSATSIYLKGSLNFMVEKLSHPKRKSKRPLIAHIAQDDLKEFIAKHLFERNNYYDQANHTVIIDHKSKKEITNEIAAIVKA